MIDMINQVDELTAYQLNALELMWVDELTAYQLNALELMWLQTAHAAVLGMLTNFPGSESERQEIFKELDVVFTTRKAKLRFEMGIG